MNRESADFAIEKAFGRFFRECNCVVGSEANYQAMLALELEREFPTRVRRERRIAASGKGGVDVMVLNGHGEPEYAFELKGGAYNSRNALQDVFDTTGNCSDMQKLAKLPIDQDKRWLVAIDATELGRSLRYRQQMSAVHAASAARVGFTYFAHGDDSFLMAQAGSTARYPSVLGEDRSVGRSVEVASLLEGGEIERSLRSAANSAELEADLVAAIYRALMEQGYSSKQVALETYFGFAPGAMHQRPDICLFEPSIDGHFNLYPRGNVAESYDAVKLRTLRMMMEVKGGAPLLRRKDSTLSKVYRNDIEKLGRWRTIVSRAEGALGVGSTDVSYLLIGADMRQKPMATIAHHELSELARHQGVLFKYVHMPV